MIKQPRFPLEIMRVCVRCYDAQALSLRNLQDMMAERGVLVDHVTVRRWAQKMLPLAAVVSRRRKLAVGSCWCVDETYVRVGGQWKYPYRGVEKFGQTMVPTARLLPSRG